MSVETKAGDFLKRLTDLFIKSIQARYMENAELSKRIYGIAEGKKDEEVIILMEAAERLMEESN